LFCWREFVIAVVADPFCLEIVIRGIILAASLAPLSGLLLKNNSRVMPDGSNVKLLDGADDGFSLPPL
jgi:hypothetical protein